MTVQSLAALVGTGVALFGASAGAATGTIAGSFEVSPLGAATYTIPINVPEGMLGLKPDIALAYNSQGGDGSAGMGWTLSGFSKITRCPLSIAVDGKTQGVQYSTEDRFCLDGVPLVLMSTNGDVKEYRTEIYQYQQIKAYGTIGTGPSYFIVKQPKGTAYYYGNDNDSKIEAPGTTEVRVWALNEVENTSGHKIDYSYTENSTNGEYYPNLVRWTYAASNGETVGSAKYRLIFTFEDRDDTRSGYVGGSIWSTTKRLQKIEYKFGGALVHTYALGYQYGATGGRSQLESVLQSGPSESLPTTTMQWLDAEEGFGSGNSVPYTAGGQTLLGDFNGDGDADLYRLQIVTQPFPSWLVAFSQGDGTFGSLIDIGQHLNANGQLLLDFNGDGRKDILYNIDVNAHEVAKLSLSTGNESGPYFTAPTTVSAFPYLHQAMLAQDVNGDGRDDIVAPGPTNTIYTYINNGTDFNAATVTTLPAGGAVTFYYPGSLRPADFDGDGRADLLVARGSSPATWQAYLSNGNGFTPTPSTTGATTPSLNDAVVLDINGDGLSDVLLRSSAVAGITGGTWISRLSTGKAGAAFVAPSCTGPTITDSFDRMTIVDVDSDGRMDVVRPNGSSWRIQKSNGTCYPSANYSDLSGGPSAASNSPLSGDLTGDGSLDLVLGTFNVGEARVHNTPAEGPLYNVLKRITDGLGNYYAPEYQVLSNWSGYHVSGSDDLANGIRLVRGGSFGIVEQYDASSGVGSGSYNVKNEYWGGRTNFRGRGFLGFEHVKDVDSRNSVATHTQYKQLFPFTGLVELRFTCSGATGAGQLCSDAAAKKITAANPTWAVNTQNTPSGETTTSHFPYMTSEVTDQFEVQGGTYLGAVAISKDHQLTDWDFAHGMAKADTLTTSSPQTPETWKTVRAITPNDDLMNNSWCLGQPTKVDTTKYKSAVADPVRTVQYLYHANCAQSEVRIGPSGDPTKQLKIIHGIDDYGRPSSITQRRGDDLVVAQRQTIIGYDDTYYLGFRRYSESSKVAGESDHVVLHTWNDLLGLELARTSVQGQQTFWDRDEFGRLTVETRPAGSSNFTYSTCGAPGVTCTFSSAKYKINELRSDGYSETSGFDSMGRIVGREHTVIGGTSYEQFAYNALGQMTSQSVPYLSGTPFYINRQFDFLGRPVSEIRQTSEADSSDTSTTWAYSRLTTTVAKSLLGETSTSVAYTNDPEGRLWAVDVQESAGPTNGDALYGYTAWGELNFVEDADGHQTSMFYDDRGSRYKVVDPDSGTREYEYNIFGELEKIRAASTTAPTWTSQTQYDQVGRPFYRTEGEGATNWQYFKTAGASKGLLDKVASPGFEQSHLYSSLALLQKETTKIDGVAYVTDYTYNAEGQLDVMTYPAGIGGLRQAYKHLWASGYLDTIEANATGTDFYNIQEMDALGRESKVILGNNVLDYRHVYDRASTQVNEIKTVDVAGGTVRQWYTYQWDKAGNLRQRLNKNSGATIQEDFDYDHLSRLKTTTLNNVQTQAYFYTADGNIDYRVDQGVTYNYLYTGAGGPHQVSGITSGSGCTSIAEYFTYNANGNMDDRNGGVITHTSFDKPAQVDLSGGTCSGNCTAFSYGADRELIKQTDKYLGATRAIVYAGPHFEIETAGGVTKYRSNIFANGVNVYSVVDSTGAEGLQAYWLLRDHIGSVDTLRRETGGGADGYRFSFSAFGKRRYSDNWMPDSADSQQAPFTWNHRGFTDHETLDSVKLVHMKGRVYDPKVGRMLESDPVLGDLSQPQTLNPYTYVANNPLRYTDPDGLFLGKIGDVLFRVFGEQVVGKLLGFAFGGALCDPDSTKCAIAMNLAGRTIASLDGGSATIAFGHSFGAQSDRRMSDLSANPYVLNVMPTAGFADVWLSPESLTINKDERDELRSAERRGMLTGAGIALSVLPIPVVEEWAAAATLGRLASLGRGTRVGAAAANGTTATKSTLQIGQQMHRAYKVGVVNGITRFKEFRFATGRRADFIDFEKGIIYELKPNNARSIREGTQQLQQYLKDAQSQFPGIKWSTVLDTY